jgi:microsomal dipeptidase-like Zn-dependent dipeptidase
MITAIAARYGVILIAFDPARLVPPERPRRAGVSNIAEHVEYVMKLAGPESVGIGSCFGGGGGVPGCRNTGEILELTIELLRRGHAEATVEAVWGGNIMSVFKRVAGGAEIR